MAEGYERGMEWCLARPGTVFAVGLLSLVVTVLIAMQLPREILPQVDEGTAVAELRLAPGTAIEETSRQAARLEAAAKALGSEGI